MWKEPRTIREMLERNVEDFGNREALASISCQTGNWAYQSWAGLDRMASRVAAGLDRLGVKKGQKIAFIQDNCIECIYVYLAVQKIGAVFVPVNTRFVAREVEYMVRNSDAEHIAVGVDLVSRVEALRANVKNVIWMGRQGEPVPPWATSFSDLLEENGLPPKVAIGPGDEADLIFTSGTTGNPKGVVLTQANKVANGRLSGAARGVWRCHHAYDKLQTSFPFFTSAGVSTTQMGWLYYGYTLIMEEKFDAVKVLQTIERERTTVLAAAPAMLVFILDHPSFNKYDTSSIRGVIFGGAAMPEEVIRRIAQTWADIKLYNFYGLTEAGPGGTCHCIDGKNPQKINSVGIPWLPDQEIRVVDEEDRDVAIGEPGEIIIRGPNVMKGYYKNPEATDEAMRNGWLHTGDIGCFDDDRCLYYKDRKKDMIVRGGFNIYPAEVECVLYEHPNVQQCAIIGKPHKKLGEDLIAFVTTKKGKTVTVEELSRFCAARMADFKCPRDIRIVDSLPLNSAGKIDKVRLRIA